MNTRIRYGVSETDSNLLKSKKLFNAKNRQFYVVLNEKSFHYVIQDAKTKEVVASGGNTTNASILRQQAKQGLENLGVSFADETRKARRVHKLKIDETQSLTKKEVIEIVESKILEILSLLEKKPKQTKESKLKGVSA